MPKGNFEGTFVFKNYCLHPIINEDWQEKIRFNWNLSFVLNYSSILANIRILNLSEH